MSKTRSQKRTKTAPAPLPLRLHTLAMHIDPERNCVSGELSLALAEARKLLCEMDHGDRGNMISNYVDRRATSEEPAALAQIESLDISGEAMNAYMEPALYLGIALAYLWFTEAGDR